jgi:hypothetical protein
MRLCADCGFAFNAAFRAELLDYGADYDNTQTCSPAFDAYVDALVRELVEGRGVRGRRVAEVGCGKGAFLRKLVAYPGAGNTGVGYDTSYVGPGSDLEGRLRFRRVYFDGSAEAAEAVVCRHVIEHVADPADLLRPVRAGCAAGAPVFFETPCLEWILRGRVFWDFFYEHCSLFTAHSLAVALTRAGFGDIEVCHVFGGQYLWLCARAAPPGPAGVRPRPSSEVARLARAFAHHEPALAASWRELVRRRSAAGPVALWGAGAKGVTFCNLVDPEGELLDRVVDVNPAKQGRYVAGTGHAIVGPDAARGVATVVVLNPNYTAEVAAELARRGSRAVVLDATPEGEQACA